MRKGTPKGHYPGLWKHPRTGIYWYRLAVPKLAQAALCKTAINQTLSTRDHSLAVERWGGVNAEWRAKIRAACSPEARSINDDLAGEIATALMESASQDEANPYTSWEALNRAAITELIEADLSEREGIGGDGSWIEFGEFTEADIEAIVTAVIDQRLAMFVGLLNQNRDRGAELNERIREVTPEGEKQPRLMDAFDLWKAHGDAREKSADDFKSSCLEFIQINGDLPMVEFTEDHFRAYKNHLYATKSKKSGKPLAQMTRNKKMGGVKAVFESAIEHGLIKVHPGSNIVVEKGKKSKLRIDGLFDDEIKLLFGSPVFTKQFRPKEVGEAGYWVPVLAFFTGARQSELCQLMVADVVKRDGIICLRITDDEDEGQHVKTEGSVRLVPLADKVLRLGFMKYVAALDQKGKLFPDVRADSHGVAGGLFSRWYGKHRKEIGLTRKGADFHAIRHLAKTALRSTAGDSEAKFEITGHSNGTVSAGYGRIAVKEMKKIVDQIAYDVVIPKWKPDSK